MHWKNSLFFSLLIGFQSLFANEYSLTSFESDPSALVAGKVNVITGDPVIFQQDLVIQGAEPIVLTRAYINGIQGSWSGGVFGYVEILPNGDLAVSEKNGSTIVYRKKSKFKIGKEKFFRYEPINLNRGFSNTSHGEISGRTNLKNYYIIFNKDLTEFVVHVPDGTLRTYRAHGSFYHIESEKLANGNWVLYEYDIITLSQKKDTKSVNLKSIRTTSPDKTKTYAKADFLYEDPKQKNCHFYILGSDGSSAEYRFEGGKKHLSGPLSMVISSQLPNQKYSYVRFTPKYKKFKGDVKAKEECRLQEIRWPLFRVTQLEYYWKDKEVVAGQEVEMDDYWIGPLNPHFDPRRGRIKTISSPVGEDDKLYITHSFLYDVKNKKTSVYEIDGNRTDYSWDESLRLRKIERFSKENTLLNAEGFVWGFGGADLGNLCCKTLFNENMEPVVSTRYFYDAKGNIVEERLYGNLSGNGAPIEFDFNGVVCGGQHHAKFFKYSSENLSLLTESIDGDLRIVYEYLPGTDLVVSQYTYEGDQIRMRKFWQYSSDHLLVREITDDGSSLNPEDNTCVRVRKLQEIIRCEEGPYAGMPLVILEKYWESGKEHLLRKTVLTYGSHARIVQKEVYDADDKLRYQIHMDYDEKGRLIRETNPLGQSQTFTYDECGNQIGHCSYSQRKNIRSNYDYSNRLAELQMKGDDGIFTEEKTVYNQKGRKIAQFDTFGRKTKYRYNGLGHLIQTEFPGVDAATSQSICDSVGNVISQIDAEGNATQISYNARGKPILITHPDGSQEKFSYFLNGCLKAHIDAEGIKTRYTYDYLGRLTFKEIEDSQEEYQYEGALLKTKIDPEGNRTVYTYDGAGRKKSEVCGSEKISYRYDALGRVFSIEKHDCITFYEYDLLDRVLEEKTLNPQGETVRQVQYEYDADGNKKTAICFVGDETSIARVEYDSLGRVIRKTDPFGAVENYEYLPISKDGFHVLQTIHTDALGLKTIETFNARNWIAKKEKKKDQMLLLEEKTYDRNGHLQCQTDTIFSPDGSSRQVSTYWNYDERGRLKKLLEAGEKTTLYEYTLKGKLHRVVKPDGTAIVYDYDTLGHLSSILSTDGTVKHILKHDKLGRLIEADGIRRSLDAKARILKEEFSPGYGTFYSYDPSGKKTSCSIPMADCHIEYQYDAGDLTRVARKTNRGDILYSHDYFDYDLSGNAFKETSIFGQPIEYDFDLISRKIKVSSPLFSQENVQFDPVGNLLQTRIQNERIDYGYDDLYQLISEKDHEYQFDTLHNRLQKDSESYQINDLHQVISHLQYNPNGNPIQYGDAKYTYDALDRLIRIDTPECSQILTYDAWHRCIQKTTFKEDSEETFYFLYDGNCEIGALDSDLHLRELRVLGHAPHAEMGASIAIELKGEIYAPIHDLQGNIATLFSPKDSCLYRYSAFGEPKRIGNIHCPWGFSSKRTDLGLVNFGRRFYLPELGRFLTPDPSGFKDGMNLYAYVHNAPLTHFDEYGLITYLHGTGWQNCPWGSRFSYLGNGASNWGAPPPSSWNRAGVDSRYIPSMDLYYKYSPHYYINGINNTERDCRIGAAALKRSLGESSNVIPIYSESFGFFRDLVSVYRCRNNPDYTSFAVRRLQRAVLGSALCMEAMNDPRKVFITAFSRGAGDTYHAVKDFSPEMANRLIITTCGPIMILARDLGFSVTNLVSRGDWCSLFCNSQLRRNPYIYEDASRVQMLDQKDGFSGLIRDHFFLSQTYQSEIGASTSDLYKKYGGVR